MYKVYYKRKENKMESRVFLGGTCNNSLWRNALIPLLKVDYFNPVVDDWTEDCYQEELKQRKVCKKLLYVITPKMEGVYSIAELIEDSIKNSDRTVFCFIIKDGDSSFSKSQIKSLEKVKTMAENNGATFLSSLEEIAEFLNSNLN